MASSHRQMDGDTAQGPSPASAPALLVLVTLGLGAGLSPFFFSYYGASVWVPIGLALTLTCAIAVVASPARPSGPGGLALAGVLGLGVWSLASIAWSESVENAFVSANRWLVYGALFLLMLVLLRSSRHGVALLGAVGLGTVAVALSVVLRMLGESPGSLFLEGRLNSPLGYINGEGCLFVMGFWLCLAVGEARRALLAGPAAGLAAVMACLALLSQSRGTALAMLASLVIVLAIAPGRVRRGYLLLVVAGGAALAAPDLLHVYDRHAGSALPVGVAHAAGRSTRLAGVGVGVLWALLTGSWARALPAPAVRARARRIGSWLLVVPVALAVAVAGASAGRIEHDVSRQWHAFTHLAPPPVSASAASSASESRLLSGVGNRYDYWRIAWRVWQAHPMLGVGAGNYPRSYYEQRATTEDIEQPHSIELQALSELGLVGALLLLCFVGGVGWGAFRMRGRAIELELPRALLVAGLGAFAAWLAQTSVDWMHLLPGLTAFALAAASVVVSRRTQPVRVDASGHASWLTHALTGTRARALGAAAVIVILIVTGASLSRQGLADLYRSRAQSELAGHPAQALADADRSLDIDSDSAQSYYIKAAALARFDQAAPATSALDAALAREPRNFVTWALLGDLAVRERMFAHAKRDYDRAHQLNPKDETLRALALDPRTAFR
jgi:hypothetical protein